MAKRKTEIPDFVIELGKRIREIRKEKEMSIEEVAYKAEIDAQNLRKYELGRQEMKVSMLKRISDSMGVNLNELLAKI
ncbi:MAG: helix-turn-helix transcriptional regulator [Crocinitomicaceae bacterium]